MSDPLHQLASTNDDAALYVLHGRGLRPDVRLKDTAVFDDDEWPLAPAARQAQERGLTLRFATIPERYRTAAKHVAYSGLSGPLPRDETRPRLSSIVSVYYNLAVFLRWLDEKASGPALRAIDRELLQRFQSHLSSTYASPARRTALRSALVFLWRYRSVLGDDSLTIDPRTLPGWTTESPFTSENTTARIPEEVHSRVLVWAMRFVDDYAPDVHRAVERWNQLRTRGPARYTPSGEATQRIQSYLESRYQQRAPLPSANGKLSMVAISRVTGTSPKTLEGHFGAIRAAAAELGVSDFSTLDLPIEGELDGTPWIGGITVDPARDDSLTVLTQMLQAACYIVIAFLSGMRDSEVKHLTADSVRVLRDSDGTPYRWIATSTAFKGELSESGTTASWVIGAPAARAIQVLADIHKIRSHDGSDFLFAPIKCGPGAGSAGRRGNIAMTLAGSNRQLNRFVKWVNDYCRQRGREDGIPDHNGEPWKLSTRQFRRTLAWFIARQPGGSIAGAIAYRHHSVQMFEGYAGTSESGFRAEVEAEQALERGEYLLAMIDQHEHESLTGPSADEAATRLRAMKETPGFAGTVTTDRRRMLRLINVHGPAVYPGKYVTCVYTHSRALCRPRDESAAVGPDRNNCKPLACTNVALTEDNHRAWESELTQLDLQIASGDSLPPALLARLRERREQILALTQEQD